MRQVRAGLAGYDDHSSLSDGKIDAGVMPQF
jgi:hypothetical protein